jgi:hypothetical protein
VSAAAAVPAASAAVLLVTLTPVPAQLLLPQLHLLPAANTAADGLLTQQQVILPSLLQGMQQQRS